MVVRTLSDCPSVRGAYQIWEPPRGYQEPCLLLSPTGSPYRVALHTSYFRPRPFFPGKESGTAGATFRTGNDLREVKDCMNTQNRKEPAHRPTKKQVYILLSRNIFLSNSVHFFSY